MRNRLSNTQLMFNTLVRDSRTSWNVWVRIGRFELDRRVHGTLNWASNFRKNRTAKMIMDPKYIYVEMFTEFRFLIEGIWLVIKRGQWETLKASGQTVLMFNCFRHSWNSCKLLVLHACIRKSLKSANSERFRCEHFCCQQFS